MLKICKSLEKTKGKKKGVQLSLRGRKHDQEDPGLLDSRNILIPLNPRKMKKQKKKW